MKKLLGVGALLCVGFGVVFCLGALAFAPIGRAQAQVAKTADETAKDKGAAILFFREHHFAGSALKPSIYVDDKEVNRLSNGRWFVVKVEPGKHKLQSSAKNEPATVVDVAPGETAYVQMVITTGNWRGGGRLLTVDSKEAQEKVAKLKQSDEKDRD
jgi:Protein of unknown function (DUF2846)